MVSFCGRKPPEEPYSPPEVVPGDINSYIKNRLDDQITWYDKKAVRDAQNDGYSEGWNAGRKDKQEKDYNSGWSAGYEFCLNENKTIRNNYDEGYDDGHDSGFVDGYSEGYRDGFSEDSPD